MVTNPNNLNYVLNFYQNEYKIARTIGNFLVGSPGKMIVDMFAKENQDYYTHVEIEFQGKPVARFALADKKAILVHY